MAITGRRIYGEMQGIRAKDVYPDEEVKAFLVERTFPKSAEDMTLKLSNVTAAFYGLTLANVGERFGWKEADAADLVSNLREKGVLFERLVRVGTRPPVS
jgi:hypothetical protein